MNLMFDAKTVKTASQSSPRICVVDDDAFVVGLIGRSLSMADYKNSAYYDSAEKFIQEVIEGAKNASLVISDIVLPGINGFELCTRVKAFNLELPVILISGFDIEDVHLKVIECGADDFIAKPFNPTELITRVKIHLAKYERVVYSALDQKPSFSQRSSLPFIGDQVGDYLITDTVGWGKSSFIFKTNKKTSKSVYALKMLAPHITGLKDLTLRFENEVNIMEKIRHPNIVAFVERGNYNSIPFVVMEYINGPDLEEYLITRGKIPVHDALEIAHGMASAISELHGRKIIHRDIKLKNIIFDVSSKSPKLIDFGIAKEMESSHLTNDGFVIGTPIYMAPEIFEGKEASVMSDIYSFGATVYHLLTGAPPFVGDNSKELYRKHLTESPLPMETFRSDVPAQIENLISKACLSKNQNQRPESMRHVEENLRTFISKNSVNP